MDLTETFVSSIVSLLVENLAPAAFSFIIPKGGIDEKLKEWRKILSRIEAVLEDAEDRQSRETSVQQWLLDVQNLVYEIDDFVDDFATDARRHQEMIAAPESSRPTKLPKFVSGLFSSITNTSVSFNPATNLRITEISDCLQELEERKNNLGLKEYIGGKSDRIGDLRLPSTSLVDPALVYGREEDRAAFMKLLLEDGMSGHDGKLHIISIVAMGGIGKTTLAQSLYNHTQVKDCFHYRMWVCVTEDFDVLKISKIIYEDVYEKSCKFNDLNKVQVKLVEKLSKKKFLLVLDDVWNQDYLKWDLLCAPFHGGASGSTIIVTTRSQDVAKVIGSKEVYDLKGLSDGDCLSLLAQHAFGRPNFDGHPEFNEVGEVIAKRCKGLPLAAKSLGGLLRTKRNPKLWAEVSTSKIWELQSNGIIGALRLSYHYLPPYLKPLFVYCSLFPKGYEFDKQELIMLWMAQGFLKQSGEQKQMEELGCEYFSELLSRSFFQRSTWKKSRFVMHDLNNELAQFVAGLTYLRLDDKMASNNEQYMVSEEARHISFISHEYADSRKFKAFSAVQSLRTILPFQESCRSYLSIMVLNDILPRLRRLRVLSLSWYYINELPNSIGNLKHLRYLNLSWTDITELPQSICDLYNLQTLLLQGCSKLIRLPSSIERLINLRHLNLSGTNITEVPHSICELYNLQALLLQGCSRLVRLPSNIQRLIHLRHLDNQSTPSLKEMPPGIGILSCLRTLPKFIINKSDGRKITELKGLHHLQGTISIMGMENVMNVQDAMDANLLSKKGVHGLEMKWSSSSNDSGLEFDVLDALKPHISLASLGIEFYGGQKFPGWVGDRLFGDMVKVRLVGCKNCATLPPLGQLTSLKELFIQGMHGLKIVGPEFLGTGFSNVVGFQSLIKLSFMDMDSWEEWSADSTNGAFPCLQSLKIGRCMKLNKVSLDKIPSLESLEIYGCSEMVLRCMAGVGSVKKLEIFKISGLSKLDGGIIECLGEVEDLSVSYCYELIYLWEEEVACQVLEKLKSLSVNYCKQLKSLGDEDQLLPRNLENLELLSCDKLEKMPNWQNNLTSLRRLTIQYCVKLQDKLASTTNLQLNTENHGQYEFSNLESVYIYKCPSLKWFPTGKKLPSTLKDLYVWDCQNMEVENDVFLSLLESVCFDSWSKLKSLPQGLAHLTRLEIQSCWGIESIPETSLPPTLVTLQIRNCKNLKYMYDNEMQSLSSLRELIIIGCENLEGYPSGGHWPPNLETLRMGEVKQPITEWGLASLPTSLLTLQLDGNFPQLVSFPKVGSQFTTPTSLTHLEVRRFKNLEYVGTSLGELTSLQHLYIYGFPKLRELPETVLPTLSSLEIELCPLLRDRCKKDYWPKISHIPFVAIDGESMWGL